MPIVEQVKSFQTALGGEPHTGWSPANAAVPLPTPVREIELDLTIDSIDGGGYLLIYETSDGSVRGDTWHVSSADAREQAQAWFGVPRDVWVAVEDD
jgi:hypothetical protein